MFALATSEVFQFFEGGDCGGMGSKNVLRTSTSINPALWFCRHAVDSGKTKFFSKKKKTNNNKHQKPYFFQISCYLACMPQLKKNELVHKSVEVLKFHNFTHRYLFGIKLTALARCACCCHLHFWIILCNCHHKSVTQKCLSFFIFVQNMK